MNSIKKLENYVISLTSAHDRKAHIREQFNLKNIEFNFFDAVTPDNVEAVAWNLNFQIKNNILTVNELACFLSKLQCIPFNCQIGSYLNSTR